MLLGYIKIYESITFLFDYKWLMIVNRLSIVQFLCESCFAINSQRLNGYLSNRLHQVFCTGRSRARWEIIGLIYQLYCSYWQPLLSKPYPNVDIFT